MVPDGIQSGQTFAVELPSPEQEQGQRGRPTSAQNPMGADESDTVELEVMCPPQCAEGDEFDIETEYGDFPVRVPAGTPSASCCAVLRICEIPVRLMLKILASRY